MAVRLVRKADRKANKDWTVRQHTDSRGRSRGKGDHMMWAVCDAVGEELARVADDPPGRHVLARDPQLRGGLRGPPRERMDGPVISYRVVVSREDPWWTAVAYGEGLPPQGAATETRTIADLEDKIRDLIVLRTDPDLHMPYQEAVKNFDLDWDYP
jgi:hypothetical protein